LLALVTGGNLGALAYAVAAALIVFAAPRQDEGVRRVVDMPWPVFATMPTAAAVAAVLLACRWIATRGQRLWFVVSASVVVLACSSLALEILRRDYVGKL